MTPKPNGIENNPEITPADLESMHRELFRWAWSNAGYERDLAHDILQEAYLRVWSGRARFHGTSTLRTWMYAVVRNTAADHRRAATSVTEAMQRIRVLAPDPPAVPMPDAILELESESARVLAGLLSLSTQQRLVLELVFYSDLSIEEAARVLGVSVGTARRHYTRGKQHLRRLLADADKTAGIECEGLKQYG